MTAHNRHDRVASAFCSVYDGVVATMDPPPDWDDIAGPRTLDLPVPARRPAWLRSMAAAAGTAAAVLVLVGSVAWLTRGSPADENQPPLSVVWSDVVWRETPVPIPGGAVAAVAGGPQGLVAFGYGLDGDVEVLLSDDGLAWELSARLDPPRPGEERRIAGLTYADGQYVAVGSSFSEVGGAALDAYLSADGRTWNHLPLPFTSMLDIDGVQLVVHTELGTVYTDQVVAASGDEIAVLGTQFQPLTVMRLLDERLPQPADNMSFIAYPDSVVVNPGEEDERRYAWDELGMSPLLASYLNPVRPEILVTRDGGETWEVLPDGLALMHALVRGIAHVDGTTYALTQVDGGRNELWASDGGVWERVELGPGLDAIDLAQRGETVYVLAGVDGGERRMLLTSVGGGDWSPVEDDALSRMDLLGVNAGEGGIVVLGRPEGTTPRLGPVALAAGEYTVEVYETGMHRVRDADGDVVVEETRGDILYSEGVSTILDPETGEPVVEFTDYELNEAWAEAYARDGRRAGVAFRDRLLLAVSPDGSSWHRVETPIPAPAGPDPSEGLLAEYEGALSESTLLLVKRDLQRAIEPPLWVGSSDG